MKSREIIGRVKQSKTCSYCQVKTFEPMNYALYGGGSKYGVGGLYTCINVQDCLSRMREASDRKGTPKARTFVVDLCSFRVVALSYDEAVEEAKRILKGNNFVPAIGYVELAEGGH